MEVILNFFEEYWGYTLFGGVTVGTLVMFVITAIKLFITMRKNKADNETLVDTTLKVCSTLTSENTKLKDVIAETQKQLQESVQQRIAENKYFSQIQAVTFKSISYLIMSSKLSNEDKMNIYEEMSKLSNTSVEQLQESGKKIEEDVEALTTEAEKVEESVTNVIEKSKTLLDKYSKEV